LSNIKKAVLACFLEHFRSAAQQIRAQAATKVVAWLAASAALPNEQTHEIQTRRIRISCKTKNQKPTYL
jgi:hypothetical protein